MAEQLLDRAQIGAALEQVRCERVAQPVRVRRQAAQRRGVEAPAASREEQCVDRAPRQLGARFAEVAGDPVRCVLAERHDPVLRALAVPDVDVLLLEVDVAEIETDRLRAAQPRRVDDLEQRAIADPERISLAECVREDRFDLLHLGRVGEPPAAALVNGTSGTAPGRGRSE